MFGMIGLFYEGSVNALSKKVNPARKEISVIKEQKNLLWFDLHSPETFQEKDITFAWPKNVKSNTIIGLSVELKPLPGSSERFVLSQQLPLNWKKNSQLQIPIKFLYPEMTQEKQGNQTRFQAQFTLQGITSSAGKLIILSQALITADVSLPPKAQCKPIASDITVHSIEKDPVAFYQCTNQGKGPLKLWATWTCENQSISIHSDLVEINPQQSGALTAVVAFSNIKQSEIPCSVKVKTNNPKSIDWEATLPIRIVRSAFVLQLTHLQPSAQQAKLYLRSAEEWALKIPATPVNTQKEVTLQVQTISAKEIEEVALILDKKPNEELPFTTKLQDGFSFQIMFSPQKDNHLYTQSAYVRVRYRDAKKNSQEQRIPITLYGSTQFTQRTLPGKTVNVCTEKEYQIEESCVRGVPASKWIEQKPEEPKFTDAHLLGSLATLENFYVKPLPFREIPNHAKSYFVPVLDPGTLFLYRPTLDLLMLERTELPVTFRYRPNPIGMAINAAVGPGVLFSPGNLPEWNLQVGIYAQWESYIDTKDRRILFGIGAEGWGGGMYRGLSEIKDGAQVSIPFGGGDFAIRLGGDLLTNRKLGLFLNTGLGYGYINPSMWFSQPKLLGHQFHFSVSPEIRFRLWDSLQGLYLFIRPTFDLFVNYNGRLQNIRFPIGVHLEF